MKLRRVLSLFAIPLLAAVAPLHAIERAAPDVTAAMKRAETAVNANQWEEVVAAYTDVLSVDAQNWKALIGRASAFAHLQLPALSEADYDRAVAVAPKSFEPLMARGLDRFLKKRYADSVSDLDAAVRLKPDKIDLYHWRGCAYAQNDQPAQAIADFNKVIERDPEGLHGMEFFNRGLAEHALGKLDAALADYEAAEKAGQHTDSAKAECLLDLRRWRDAEEIFSEVLRTTDEDGVENRKNRYDALRNRAVALAGQKLFDRAEADIAAAIEMEPENIYAYGTASWTRLFAGKTEDARNAALKALNTDPTQLWIHLNLAHAYLLEGHYDWATAIYTQDKDKRGSWGRTGAQIALQDIADLREAGIDHPDFAKAEKFLHSLIPPAPDAKATASPSPASAAATPAPAETP